MTLFEDYFPFDAGLGANTRMLRWRKMARLWQPSGVVRGVGQEFAVLSYDLAQSRIAIGTGACWVNGFYGELTRNETGSGGVWLDTPGNDGIVTAQLDPFRQVIILTFAAWHGVNEQPDAYWEAPLWDLFPDGRLVDRRHFVPEPATTPPPTIPASTPQGVIAAVDGPASLVLVDPTETVILDLWPASYPRFTPGRSYRISAWGRPSDPGRGAFLGQRTRLQIHDDAGFRVAQDLSPSFGVLTSFGGTDSTMAGYTAVTVAPLWGNALCRISCDAFGATSTPVNFEAWSCRIEVEDVGLL